MQEKITGKNYSYIIKLTKEGKRYCFEILCWDKNSKQKSRITNLNFILSSIVSDEMDEIKIEDSWIDTTGKKTKKLFSVATECFKNRQWINKLESKLDEDRICGEWEANFKI